MECSISAQNSLVFVKALHCLQRFGDDLCLQACGAELKLSTVSATRSAFGMITFDKVFFQHYTPKATAPSAGSSRSTGSPSQIQVATKAMLAVLRPRTVSSSLESCSLSLHEDSNSVECRLIIRLFCQHGVTKTHRLNYQSTSALFPLASRDACTSSCIAHANAMQDWTEHFWTGRSLGVDEITLWCSPSFCKLRNYESSEFDLAREKGKGRSMSTTLSVDLEDFEDYRVASEQLVTFSLRELKAIIAFADAISSSVEMAFSTGGEPIIFSTRGDGVTGDYVIATTADDPGAGGDVKPDVRAVDQAARNGPSPAANGRPLSHPAPARPTPPAASQPGDPGQSRGTALFRADSTVPDSQGDMEFDDFGDLDQADLDALDAGTQPQWNLHDD